MNLFQIEIYYFDQFNTSLLKYLFKKYAFISKTKLLNSVLIVYLCVYVWDLRLTDDSRIGQ